MDKASKGFSSLRHGLPVAIIAAGLLSGLLALVPERLQDRQENDGGAGIQLKQEAGILTSIIQIQLDPDKPASLQTQLETLRIHLSAQLVLFIDTDGTVVASSRRDYLGKGIDTVHTWLANSTLDLGRTIAAMGQNGSSLTNATQSSTDGQNLDGVFLVSQKANDNSSLEHPVGYLFLREPIFASKDDRAWLIFSILAPTLILAAIATWLLNRSLPRQVNALIHTLERFGAGNLGVRVKDSWSGELGALTATFNKMADDVAAAMLLVRRRAARLGDVLDGLPELLFIVHADGSILEYRGGTLRKLGDGPKDFIGRKITEVLPGKLQHTLTLAMHDAVLGQKTSTVQYDLELTGGTEYYEAQLRPISDDQIIVLVRNITERHKQGTDAQLREDRLIQAERSTGVVGSWYWELGSDSGIWSDGLYRIFGLQKTAPVTFEYFLSSLLPEDIAVTMAQIESAVRGSPPRELVFRVVTVAGAVRRLRCLMNTVSTSGRVSALQGTVMDVTGLSLGDEELREFFDKGPQYMAIVSANGKLLRTNTVLANLLGLTPNATVPAVLWKFVVPDDIAKARRFLNRALAANEPVGAVFRCLAAEGEERSLAWYAKPSKGKQRLFLCAHDQDAEVEASGQVVPLALPQREADIPVQRGPNEVGTWRYDLGTETMHWSPAIFRILGADPQGPIPSLAMMLTYFGPAEARKDLVLALHRCLEYGQDFVLPMEASVAKGRKVAVRISGQRQNEGTGTVLGTLTEVYSHAIGSASGDVLPLSAGHGLAGAGGRVQRIAAPLPDPLRQIVDTLERDSEADHAVIALADVTGSAFGKVIAASLATNYVEALAATHTGRGEGVCAAAMAEHGMVVVKDIATDPIYEQTRVLALAERLHHSVAAPLTGPDGLPLGVVALYYRTKADIKTSDLRLLTDATHLATRVLTAEGGYLGTLLLEQLGAQSGQGADYGRVIEASPVPIMTVDLQGTILTVNAALLQTLGYTRSELTGQSFVETLLNEDSLAQFEQALEKASLGTAGFCNFSLRAQSGELVAMGMKSAPLMLGTQAGLVLVGHTQTEANKGDTLHVIADIAERKSERSPQTAER